MSHILSPDRIRVNRKISDVAASNGLFHRGANALQSRTSQGADADAARARARAACQDFLTLCKDADPGIPILKEAKAEYAKLQ